MAELELKIRTIQTKLQQLLKDYSLLQRENQRLEKELAAGNQRSLQQQLQIDSLKQQVEVTKISSGNWNEKEKKDFEKRISSYVKEIDRCIVLLSE